jgi:hypothetical protein
MATTTLAATSREAQSRLLRALDREGHTARPIKGQPRARHLVKVQHDLAARGDVLMIAGRVDPDCRPI